MTAMNDDSASNNPRNARRDFLKNSLMVSDPALPG